jgi:preprotein translocase subunit YajC
MYIKKSVYPIVSLFALLLGSVGVFAHAGMEHVMGTVTAVADKSITVETVKHTKVTILIDPATKFTNSNAQASLQDLKVGDRVVIHAKQNRDKKLVAAQVKWGAGSMQMDKMEGMDHKH